MRISKDVIGGAALSAFGLVFLISGFQYRLGTPASMGPGFFPTILSGLTILFGICIAAAGIRKQGASVSVQWRGLIAVLSSLAAFAALVQYVGLVPSVFAATALSALGERNTLLNEIIALATGAAFAAWVIFIVMLGVSMPAFRWGA